MTYALSAAVCLVAVVQSARNKMRLPAPWSWSSVFAFAVVLVLGMAQPLARVDRLIGFASLVAVLIIGRCNPAGLKWLAIALSIALVINAIVTEGTRPDWIGNPNIVSGWLLLLPWGSWSVAGILASQSIGASVALVTAWSLQRRHYWQGWLLGGAVILAVCWIRGPVLSASNRLPIWIEGLRFWLARPLVGWGPGSYYTSLREGSPEAQAMNTVVHNLRTGWGHAHNAFITIAAENGLVGLASMVWLWVEFGRVVIKSGNLARWNLLAFVLQQMIDDTWLYFPTAILIGLALVLCLDGAEK